MQSLLLFANAAEAVQTKTEIVLEGIVGLAVVLVILSLLTAIISALSLFFKEPATVAPAAATPAPAAAIPAAHAKVVVAAALHAALKDSPLLPVILAAAAQSVCSQASLQLAPSDSSWSNEGRRAIFASHVLHQK
jgi:Na+-transporting methylmalonyl-CoA/oxaloacetate decarboxylase gamma subunit